MQWFKNGCYLFLFLSLLGADSPQLLSYPPDKIMGFRGLDTSSSPPTIGDGRAEDLLNVKLSSAFDLIKRPGFSKINETSLDDLDLDHPPIQGIFDTIYSNGNSWTLVFTGSKLKYDNSGIWADVTGSASFTSGKNNQHTCIMALDNAICTNDVDVPIKIDSTPEHSPLDLSDLSDALTKAKDAIWFRNYLIFVNTVENSVERPTRWRYSNVGTIETWSDDDFVDISTFGGDEIIGLAELYGDVYVFLTKSIWKVSLVGGDDVFTFDKVIDGIGTVARDSIQVIQLRDNRSVVIFLDDIKRILMFDGVSVVDIGSLIQPTLNNLSEARLQYAVSTFDGKDYYLAATTSGNSENDIVFDYQTEIFEWTLYDQIDANAFAQVKESDSVVKTYFGNYDTFVYWMDNPDLNNDVDGASGIVDSVATIDTDTITGAQIIIDNDLTTGTYTGAIVKITSGTGSGQEAVISSATATGLIVTQSFSVTPDTTSVYSIGDINSFYTAKWYDLGKAAKEKTFIGLLFWAKQQSNHEITVSFAEDFKGTLGSETKDLAPAGSSLWDVALWDVGTWGATGDSIFTVKFRGKGNFVQPKFLNNDIDKSFHLYGFNILAIEGDTKR